MNAFLHIHQFYEAETRIVRVEEKIHVAVGPRLRASNRPEQIKMGDTEAMQFRFMGAERRDYLLSIQGTLLKSNDVKSNAP